MVCVCGVNAVNSMRICSHGPRLGLPDPKCWRTSVPSRGSHLLDARLVRVEQWSCLHVFRHQAAAHTGDVFPVPQGQQCHVLLRGLPLTCGCRGSAVHRGSAEQETCAGPGTQGQKGPTSRLLWGKLRHRGRHGWPKLLAAAQAERGLCPWFPLPGEFDQRIFLGCEVRKKNPNPVPAP